MTVTTLRKIVSLFVLNSEFQTYSKIFILSILGSEKLRTRGAADCVIDKDCPAECDCEGTLVNCSGRKLATFPEDFPSYATEMLAGVTRFSVANIYLYVVNQYSV